MKLNRYIAQIISAPNINHFSTVEIRTAYLVLINDRSLDPSNARRFTYSELLKLVKKGWLRKLVSNKKGITSFTKTHLFDTNSIVSTDDENLISEKKDIDDSSDSLKSELIERLNHYKT